MQSNKLLSKNSANILKIIFEILVLVHHLYKPLTEAGRTFNALLGPVAVAGFLFLSGYGVASAFNNNTAEYLTKLAKKRIPSTYLAIVIVDIAYLSLFFAKGLKFSSVFSFIVSVLYIPIFKDFVYLSKWVYFLADLLIYYALFLAFAYAFKKDKKCLKKVSVAITAVALIAVVILEIINATTGSARYLRGVFLFPLGVFTVYVEKPLTDALKKCKRYISYAFILLSAFLLFIYPKGLMIENIACVFGSLGIICLCFGYEKNSKVIDYLSELVIFVYLSHELFFKGLGYFYPDLSPYLIMLITIVCSVAISVLCNELLKTVKRLRFKKQKNN